MPKKPSPIFARLYVDLRTHQKIWPLPDSQYRMFVDCLMWCRERMTDGFVDARMIGQVTPVRSPRRVAASLVAAGLFDSIPGGWLVHDYHEYQDTNDVIEQRIEAKRMGAIATNSSRWGDR